MKIFNCLFAFFILCASQMGVAQNIQENETKPKIDQSIIDRFVEKATINEMGEIRHSSSDLHRSLKAEGVDIDVLAEVILSDESYQQYWMSALSLYVNNNLDHFVSNNTKIQQFMLNHLSKKFDYSYTPVLLANRSSLNLLSYTLNPDSEVSPQLKEFLQNDNLINPDYWLNTFQSSELYPFLTAENKEKTKALMEENSGYYVEMIQSLLIRVYKITGDETFKAKLEQTLKSENQRIKNKAKFLLSPDWGKYWRELYEKIKAQPNVPADKEPVDREKVRREARKKSESGK